MSAPHTAGQYVVWSPEGSEVLGKFPYRDDIDRQEAERRAKECRAYWKTGGLRARVGIRHIRVTLAKVRT